LAITNSGCSQEEWEVENLCPFQEVQQDNKKDPYPLPFIDEVINIVIGHEMYNFKNEFSRYH
jgi:hypothetical protein